MTIMDHVIIHDNVTIENNTVIGPFSIIGERLLRFYSDSKNYENPKTIIGGNSLIRSHSVIYAGCTLGRNFRSGHSIIIRENSSFGTDCMFGSFCQTDANVKIGSHVRCHSKIFLAEGVEVGEFSCLYPDVITTDVRHPPYREGCAPPRIGSKCIIGAGTTLLAGIAIGDGAFIAAASLVTSDIGQKMLAMGRPARETKSVSEIQVSGLEKLNPYPIDEEIIKNWSR